MDNKITIAVAVMIVAIAIAIGGSPAVVGASSGQGEIQVTPSDISLEEEESETIEIIYDTQSGEPPSNLEFRLEQADPEVIDVVDYELGEHINQEFADQTIVTDSAFRFGQLINQDQIDSNEFTVVTITIELEDGVDEGDVTDLTFNEVSVSNTENPNTVGGTAEAAEETQEKVEITDATLSPSKINDSEVTHKLDVEVSDISTDGGKDEFTITLPSDVAVEDITEASVDGGFDDDPTVSSGGNSITFSVNPENDSTDAKNISVKIYIQLSPEE